ncbi:MAG: sulfatase-like hydrolase/transferase [Candidatus Scalindua sp.]|nr:sulfatase-like hydrolase/transferase [Candidatus Scalindua sp.]
MNRRDFLKLTGTAFMLGSLGAPLTRAKSVYGADNSQGCVVFLSDGLRLDRTGVGGGHATPFFDTFAALNTVYPHAYSPDTWTAPSHWSMFTGYRNFQSSMAQPPSSHWREIGNIPSLAQILGGFGIKTILAADNSFLQPGTKGEGKLTTGYELVDNMWSDFPLKKMVIERTKTGQTKNLTLSPFFQEYSNDHQILKELPKDSLRRIKDITSVEGYNQGKELPPHDQKALTRYVKMRYEPTINSLIQCAKEKRPFFLFVNIHVPCKTILWPETTRWFSEYFKTNFKIDLTEEELSFCRNAHYMFRHEISNGFYNLLVDYFSYLQDGIISTLYDILKQNSIITGNTMVAYTSDHGVMYGEHEKEYGVPREAHYFVLPFDELIHIPLTIRHPKIKEKRLLATVNTTRLFHTVIDYFDPPGKNIFMRGGEASLADINPQAMAWNFTESFTSPQTAKELEIFLKNKTDAAAAYVSVSKPGGMKLVWGLGNQTSFLFGPPPNETLIDNEQSRRTLLSLCQKYFGDKYGLTLEGHELVSEKPHWPNEQLETLKSLGYL